MFKTCNNKDLPNNLINTYLSGDTMGPTWNSYMGNLKVVGVILCGRTLTNERSQWVNSFFSCFWTGWRSNSFILPLWRHSASLSNQFIRELGDPLSYVHFPFLPLLSLELYFSVQCFHISSVFWGLWSHSALRERIIWWDYKINMMGARAVHRIWGFKPLNPG